MIHRDEQATEISANQSPTSQPNDQNNSAASSLTDREVRQDVGLVLANLEIGSATNKNAAQIMSPQQVAINLNGSEKVVLRDIKDIERSGNLLPISNGDNFTNDSQINGQLGESSSSLAVTNRLGRSGPSCDMTDTKCGRPPVEFNKETGILNNNNFKFIREQWRKNSNESGSCDDEQRGGKLEGGPNCERRYRPQKYCSVCGDKAIACNFNAVTCESCKAFFRRNAFKEQRLRCLFDNCCVIDRVTRRFCSKCRLLKCLKIGMKREWILTDEQKQIKRVKIMQNKQSRQQQQQQQVSTTNTTVANNCSTEELANESAASSSATAVSCQSGNQSASGSSSPTALLSLGDTQTGANCRPNKLIETRDVSISCPDESDLLNGLVLPHCSLAHQCQFCSLRLGQPASNSPSAHQFQPNYHPIHHQHHQQHHQVSPHHHQFHQHHHLHPSHDHYHYQANGSMYGTGQQPLPHHHNLGYDLGPTAPVGSVQLSTIQNQANNEPAQVHSHQYHHNHYRTLNAGRNLVGSVSTSPSMHHHHHLSSGDNNQECCRTNSVTVSTTATTATSMATTTSSQAAQSVETGEGHAIGNLAPNLNMFELFQARGVPSLGMSQNGDVSSKQPTQESAVVCPTMEPSKQCEPVANCSETNSDQSVAMDSSQIEVTNGKDANEPPTVPIAAEPADDNADQQQQSNSEVPEENLVDWKGELFVEPVTKEADIWARVEKIDFNDTERQLIFEMIAATRPIFDLIDRPPNDTSFEDIVFFCDLALKSLIKTVKKINAFRILPMDDQIILLKNACFKILLLRSCLFYNDEQEGWIDKYGGVKYLKAMKSEKCNNYERHKELLEKLSRPLRRDYLIISFLIMYVLFDPTITLRNANSVALDNLVYLCTLRKYLLCTQPDPLAKYERLAEALRILNACNEEYNLFFSRKFQPEQITPLLIEIFDISVNDPAI